MTTLRRRADSDVPPHQGDQLFRPIGAAHRVGPGGQLARGRDGTWWYRELAVVTGTEDTLATLLRPDIDHVLRRRGGLMVQVDGAAGDGDDAGADRTLELLGMLGTQEIRDLEDALTEAGRRWRDQRSTYTVESIGEWIEAPPGLARIAETLRTDQAGAS
ncbi:hypothetical protein ABZY68_25340 [Streptomyces sp. NPDC006482]|uniref:hypothetical protein n=1 Tax=Streptomyces sp. NPDC006482 TaxID=3154306 RepID=UPI0033B9F5C4